MSEFMECSKVRFNVLQQELTTKTRQHDAEMSRAAMCWASALGSYVISLGLGVGNYIIPASITLLGSIGVFKRGFMHSYKASYLREDMAWMVQSMQSEPAAKLPGAAIFIGEGVSTRSR